MHMEEEAKKLKAMSGKIQEQLSRVMTGENKVIVCIKFWAQISESQSSAAEVAPLYSPLLLFPLDCPRAESGSLNLICSPRDAAAEHAVHVQEISNKSFLNVDAESATQTHIRRVGKSLLEIFVVPQLSGESNWSWVKSLGISSCPPSFSLTCSRYLNIPLKHSEVNSSSLRWRYHLPAVTRNDGLGHRQKGVL